MACLSRPEIRSCSGRHRLQHILDPQALRAAVQRMVASLDGGRYGNPAGSCTESHRRELRHSIFRARQRGAYLRLFADCGLRVRAITGVDSRAFKTWLWPYLAAATAAAATRQRSRRHCLVDPIDVLFGRSSVERSCTRSLFWSAREPIMSANQRIAVGGRHVLCCSELCRAGS